MDTCSIFRSVLLCALLGFHGEAIRSGFYADNNLEQTILVDKISGRERKEMQKEILTLLGLHHRPKPLTQVTDKSAPQFMLDLYETIKTEEETPAIIRTNDNIMHINVALEKKQTINEADMIMSFVNHADMFKNHRDANRRFFFDFGEVPVVESVIGAELRLYLLPKPMNIFSLTYRIDVYMVTKGQDREDRYLVPEVNRTFSASQRGWIELNVTGAATQWTYFADSNYGLYITVTDDYGQDVDPSDVAVVNDESLGEQQPFLAAFFKVTEKLHVRKPRAARKRKKHRDDVSYPENPEFVWGRSPGPSKYNRHVCQRRTMYVLFQDLGWKDWIIAPGGYAAFYCAGECSFPMNANMNATNHAIIQTLVHLMNPFRIPKPCCAPTTLSAISVLHFDDNSNVILKKFKNMVVRSCGCH